MGSFRPGTNQQPQRPNVSTNAPFRAGNRRSQRANKARNGTKRSNEVGNASKNTDRILIKPIDDKSDALGGADSGFGLASREKAWPIGVGFG